MEDLIGKARMAIGGDTVDDNKILPTNFPNNFEKDAPELSAILKG